MSWIAISVGLNVILALLLSLAAMARRGQIRRAKLETFAGVLGALTFGCAPNDSGSRFDRLAIALNSFIGTKDSDEIRWRLIRASWLRFFRVEPALVDVIDEKGRLLIVEEVKNEKHMDDVWAYFDGILDGKDGFENRPQDRFSDVELIEAQLHLERELVAIYEQALKAREK